MSAPRLASLLVAFAALVAFGCNDASTDLLSPDGTSDSRVTAGASFEWTVPARFGFDRNGDRLVDYPRTEAELHPSGWRVDFDACSIPGDRYVWYVDRHPVAFVDSCEYAHTFPAEGAYDVALHVISTPGGQVWVEQVVTVQDWLVVSFGDSYASGEGVPEVPMATDALVAQIEGLFLNLAEARAHLQEVRRHLEEAVEAKGLAEDILETARERRARFLAACSDIDGWNDVVECKDFLVERALSFELYDDARAHFDQAVANAQERVDSLTAAWEEARAAVEAAQRAVDSLIGALQAAQEGFVEPQWQEKYDPEQWGEEDCHRSALAAPALAARALEEADPRTSVTFIHLACSGGTIQGDMADQVNWANALAGEREIDAVLLSIGGNDAGFADIAVGCAVQEPCSAINPIVDPSEWDVLCTRLDLVGIGDGCRKLLESLPDRSASQILDAGLDTLPGLYMELAAGKLPGLLGLLAPRAGGPGRDGRGRAAPALEAVDRLRSDRVYITEYVDMTKNAASAYCQFDPADPLGIMPGFSLHELEWLDIWAAGGINLAVAAAAEAHGWNYVTGIYAAYRPHGYCAPAHWVVRAHETLLTQGDHLGIAHPNRSGHAVNGSILFEALLRDLYPDGIAGSPRAPDRPRAPVLTAGAMD